MPVYVPPPAPTWAALTGKPTTVAGFGITDGITTGNIGAQAVASAGSAGSAGAVPWSGITTKPTTVAGFGITDGITTSNIGAQTVAAAGTAARATHPFGTAHNMTGSRAFGGSYTNNTGFDMLVTVDGSNGAVPIFTVNGNRVATMTAGNNSASFVVLNGEAYSSSQSGGVLNSWVEWY